MHASRQHSAGRVIAANGALAITDEDGVGCGSILVSSTDANTKAATFTWRTPTADGGGAKFRIYCTARSSTGSYTVACTYLGTAGTITIDAALESPEFHRIGSTLYCVALNGSTFA